MGGFNLGELAGVLRLDDSDYRAKIADSAAATELLKIETDRIQGSVQKLADQLRATGFNLKETQGFLNSLRQQGLSTSEAVDQITASIKALQSAIVQTNLEEHLGTGTTFKTPRAPASDGGLSPSQEVEQRRTALAQEAYEITAKQRHEYDQIVDAEQRAYTIARQKFAQEQDYLGLVRRLRQEESAGNIHTKQGLEEEARIRRERKAADEAAAQDYQNLVTQMRAQEVKAAKEAGEKIEADARKRQQEIQQQMIGDAEAQVRLEKEAAERRLKAQREAEAQERAQFIEHRRQMQLAQAATTVGITAGAIGGAALGAQLFTGKEAAQFQDAMAKSLAVIGDLTTNAKNLIAATARDAAKETGLAAKDIAENFAIAAKGGLDVAQSLEFIPQAAKFAVATNSDLHESTRQLITIMEALQMPSTSAVKVMDELTVANQLARGSVDSLATMLEGKAGAALRSAKVSLEEALAMTVAFSKAGVSASQGQTFLTQVIERLLFAARQYGNEVVDVAGKQMKFRDIVYLSDGSVRPFIQTLKLLDEAFKGRSAESIGKFFDDIHLGSARGAQGLKIFLSQSGVIDELVGKFRGLSGEMQKAFDQQMQSPLKQLDKLKANLVDVAITLGAPTVAALQSLAGAFKPVLEMVQSLAAKFAELPQPLQTGLALILGLGSASLIAGGGLLVMIGHVIRLRTDLALLQSMGVISSIGGALGTVAGFALTAAAGLTTLAAAVASLFQLQKELDQQGKINNSGGSTGAKAAATSFNWLFSAYPFMLGGGGGGEAGKVKENTTKAGMDAAQGMLDGFRKKLEEIKTALQDAFKPGNFAFNPDLLLKQALKIEDVRQHFSQFSDEYANIVDRLTAEQQQIIADGMNRVNALASSGAKPEVAMSALRALEADLKRFRQQLAASDKEETKKQQQEAAADAVQAFKERYLAGLKDFSDEQNALIAGGIKTLENAARNGADPKALREDLRTVEAAWKAINDQITDVDKTTRMLAETEKKYDSEERRKQKQKPELPDITSRIPSALLPTFNANAAVGPQLTKIENAMKAMGLTSQGALDRAAAAARGLYRELLTTGAGTDELRQAWLRVQETELEAANALKPYGRELAQAELELKKVKAEGDQTDNIIKLTDLTLKTKIWEYANNGVGIAYRDLVGVATSGLSNIGGILTKLITDTKNAVGTLKSLAQELVNSLLSTLIKIGVSKILIKLGIGLDDPQTKAAHENTGAILASTVETRANTKAEIDNTDALNRLTEAINNLINSLGQGGGDGGFLGGFMGGLFGFGLKALFPPALAVPHADGGLITGNHLAMVHSGEYVINAPMTRALNGLISSGGIGSTAGDHFDFRGASFGAGLTAGSVEAMMRPVVSKLRRASGRSRNGKF